MEKLQSNIFTVRRMPPATAYDPVDGRKYTLIQMTNDGSKHLTIGTQYEMNVRNAENDHIFTAEWRPKLGEYILTGKVYINGKYKSEEEALIKHQSIQDELPGMISMVINGDTALYKHVPWLLDAQICIHTESYFPQLNIIDCYGTPRKYLYHPR